MSASQVVEYRGRAIEAARDLREFTLSELVERVGVSRPPIERLIAKWQSLGMVERRRIGKGKGCDPYTYVVRPSLLVAAKPTPERRAWIVFRTLRHATVLDLVAHATTEAETVSEELVESAMRVWVQAGVARQSTPAKPALGRPALYVLARDIGPLPPEKARITVTRDPNSGAILHGLDR